MKRTRITRNKARRNPTDDGRELIERVAADLIRGGRIGVRNYMAWQADGCAAWDACQDGAAMLGLLAVSNPIAAVAVATTLIRPVLRYVSRAESRPSQAVDVAEAWASGDASLSDLKVAADDASDAYDNSDDSDGWETTGVSDAAAEMTEIGLGRGDGIMHAKNIVDAIGGVLSRGSGRVFSKAQFVEMAADQIRAMVPCPDIQPR